MPQVINSLGHGHTQTRIPTIHTGSIIRKQAHASLRVLCAWLKNHASLCLANHNYVIHLKKLKGNKDYIVVNT